MKYYSVDNIIWQGIRQIEKNKYMIVGTSQKDGILNIGPIRYDSSKTKIINFPNASSTSVYGPQYIKDEFIQLVGSYKINNINAVFGFIYTGNLCDINESKYYNTVVTGGKFTYVHSVYNFLAVGNYDGPLSENDHHESKLGPINAFIYNIKDKSFEKVEYPNSASNTVYGIWYNGNGKYTLTGGYSNDKKDIKDVYKHEKCKKPIGNGYIVDYDIKNKNFSNWTSISYDNNSITHFEGISGNRKTPNLYQLAANTLNKDGELVAFWVLVKRTKNGKFRTLKWVKIKYPDSDGLTSSNSVAGNIVVGTVIGDKVGYQAVIDF